MIELHRRITKYLIWIVTLFFVIMGFATTFTIAPFQVPDEQSHWSAAVFRTKSLTRFPGNGVICSRAFSLPGHFDYERILAHPEERLQSGKFKTAGEAPEKCMADPVPYGFFASYPGVLISSVFFRDSLDHAQEILRWFYASRLLQGLLVLIPLLRICWIQTAPVLPGLSPLPLLILLISPLFIQQSFGVSSDAVVLSFSVYLLFFIFYYRLAVRWDYIGLFVLGILACETKPNIYPFVSILVMLGLLHRSPRASATNDLSKNRLQLDLAVFSFLGIVTLISIYQFLTTPGHPHPHLPHGVDAARQVALFKEHPFQGLWFLTRSYFSELGFSQFTSKLGWLDTNISKATANYWRILLSFAFVWELIILGTAFRKHFRVSSQQVLRTALVLFLAFGAITVSGVATCWVMYTSWTPVGGAEILGLQPRYFLPHFILYLGLGFFLIRTVLGQNLAGVGSVKSMPPRIRNDGPPVLIFSGLLLLYLVSLESDLLMRFF